MKIIFSILIVSLFASCHTAETIVSSPYSLKENKTIVYTAKTFMFKNYFFTYKDGEATLVYQQDAKLNSKLEPTYLKLKEHTSTGKYQEFTDSSKEIVVKIINQNEVRLKINKVRHTLYNPNFIKDINADTSKILADIAIWKESHY